MNQLEIFLKDKTPVSHLYREGMECFVNVSQDDGSIEGKVYYNEFERWWAFRLQSTKSRVPDFNIGGHAEAIGLSGWNYLEHKSYWVGFDFDSIINHKAGLSENDINEIINKAKEIDWVTIHKSTSGKGLHFYVFFANPPTINNRSEHSLLARAVLSNLSVLLSFDFQSKVDKSGGILWIWRRNLNIESFRCIKQGSKLEAIPPNWKETPKKFKGHAVNLKNITLSDDHMKLINWFSKQKALWWWDAEYNMLVCHTWDLQRAHLELNLKGIFKTISSGNDCPNDQNCFAFPLKDGSWIVRRHSINTQEEKTWQVDKGGWTYCYLNKLPTLEVLAPLFDGQINSKDEWVFKEIYSVEKVLAHISPNTKLNLGTEFHNRYFKLKRIKDSRVVISFERVNGDTVIGWVPERNTWQKIIHIIEDEIEQEAPDDLLRHVVADDKDAGWYIKSRERWINEPKSNIYPALESLGYNRNQIQNSVGQCILNPWELTSIPFGDEYPGDRKWNKFRCKFRFTPAEGDFSTWNLILKHIGKGLTSSVQSNSWCKAYDIMTGEAYLKLWIACAVQFPFEPLPYLFFFGPQNSGKSIFHESLELIIDKGVKRAESSLISSQGFNQELAGCIIGVVEELDLSKNAGAYGRIKDFVTSRTISIHPKGQTPYDLPNTTHWIHVANEPHCCPMKVGDTRIVTTNVAMPSNPIPKGELMDKLRAEASAFIHEITTIPIPKTNERLRLPILQTETKEEVIELLANPVEQFILKHCYIRNGHYISFEQFCNMFWDYCLKEGIEKREWSENKISRAIPLADNMPVKGKLAPTQRVHLGNITFDSSAIAMKGKYFKAGDRIVYE